MHRIAERIKDRRYVLVHIWLVAPDVAHRQSHEFSKGTRTIHPNTGSKGTQVATPGQAVTAPTAGHVALPAHDVARVEVIHIRSPLDDLTDEEHTAHRSGAADRARTMRRVVDRDALATEFKRPGHAFPLRARPGGTLERRGHTEAAVDLARLAGLPPVAVICEVLAADGAPARVPDLAAFADDHRIALVTVDQVAEQRRALARHDDRAPLLL